MGQPGSPPCANAMRLNGGEMAKRGIGALAFVCLIIAVAISTGRPTQVASATAAASCTSSLGPGIPPPANVPSGIPGFHAAWYGQSGYPTLCPGERSTATVAYYNSGSFGWVRGRMGEMAFLGTWDPIPGQDMPSQLGGDGTSSPNTGHIASTSDPLSRAPPGWRTTVSSGW